MFLLKSANANLKTIHNWTQIKYNKFPHIYIVIQAPKHATGNSIYIPWPFPPVWGVADNTKETTKTKGVSLRSSSNDEGSSRVWMALLEQHSPSSPVFHNLRHFIDAVSPTALPQGCLYKATPWQQQMPIRTASQSFATHSYS